MRNRFVFKKIKDTSNEYDTFELEMTSTAQTITDILADFECFLKGCSYNLDGKKVVLSDEEE